LPNHKRVKSQASDFLMLHQKVQGKQQIWCPPQSSRSLKPGGHLGVGAEVMLFRLPSKTFLAVYYKQNSIEDASISTKSLNLSVAHTSQR
jgi:hypothetical protein